MKTSRRTILTTTLALTAFTSLRTWAQATEPSTDGEVRKIDKDSLKITLKHGEIKNLDMPPMTMTFLLKDAAMLEGLKVGDKVRFAVEKRSGSYVVTDIKHVR